MSIIQDIQEYAREKALAYDTLPKDPRPSRTASAHTRGLSFEDVEKLLEEGRAPAVK